MTAMRARRGSTVAATVAVMLFALVGSACGLGAKQELADRIIGASRRLDGAGAVRATIAVKVVPEEPDAAVPLGPPRILSVAAPPVPAILDVAHASAAVALVDADPATAALLFHGSDIFQRLPPKSVSVGRGVPETAATNLIPMMSVATPQALPAVIGAGSDSSVPDTTGPEPTTTVAPTTTTTVKASALRRAPRIPRDWIAFDYASLDVKDTTKRAGSFALNPALILELLKGVLTGSIEATKVDGQAGVRGYEANVNRDKAERRLSEDERELRDKIYTANAISRRTFPARIVVDGNGDLRSFEVTFPQRLTNVDKADLTVTIEIASTGEAITIPKPDPKATATVGTLGQLVTRVAGA